MTGSPPTEDGGFDGRGLAVPLDDRPPSEGELFSLELLYSLQTEQFRHDHGHRLGVVVAGERRRLRYVDLELEARRLGLAFLAPPEPGWTSWRYHLARSMSDEDLVAERRTAYDRFLRALGQMSLAFRPFDMLLMRQAGSVPAADW